MVIRHLDRRARLRGEQASRLSRGTRQGSSAPPRALVPNSDLNTYSHQFPDTMERFVDGLEETYREAETASLDGLNSIQGFST
jgi:hypothetical protein